MKNIYNIILIACLFKIEIKGMNNVYFQNKCTYDPFCSRDIQPGFTLGKNDFVVNKEALEKTLSKKFRNAITVSLGTTTVATIAIIITGVPTIFTYKKLTNRYFAKEEVNLKKSLIKPITKINNLKIIL